MTNHKIFDQLLLFQNFVNVQKNEVILTFCSGKIVDLKILLADWLRAFWPIYLQQKFQQYMTCAETQRIIKIFIIEQLQRKLMNKFFFKFKKPQFWFILGPFPIFLEQNVFHKNSDSLAHTFTFKGFQHHTKLRQI